MNDKKVQQWNLSYERKENYIFYPHDEVVKFLSRFVRRRVGTNSFLDVIYKAKYYKSGEGLIGANSSGGGDYILSKP